MSIRSHNGVVAVVCLVLLLPGARAADERAAIDDVVKPFLKDKPYLALVVGITRPEGRQVFGYGKAVLDGKEQTPAGDTMFEIGSVTKVFTGTLLADQVRAGRMRLDDPVQKYLPDGLTLPRRDDRDITFLHLATHTSSLPVQPPFLGFFALTTKDATNPYAEFDQAHLKQMLAKLSLSRPIGSQFEYSNLGVGLLGHALAHAAKAKSYEDLLVERIAKPLDMTDTRIHLSASQSKRFAPAQTKSGKATSSWTFATLEACGGLRSTTNDLLTFVEANLGRRKTPLAEAFRMAHEPWRELPRKGEHIGLCWIRRKLPEGGRIMIWHNGGTGGYRSFVGFVPDVGVGVVVLSNSPHSVDEIGVAILDHLRRQDR
jgi:D-alanyl-D-alanine-carboxypeptidase/D-alanyl-D-alanine-endopeptidase